MPHLLIVCNTPSANTSRLAKAVQKGANNPQVTDVNVRLLDPLKANAEDVQWADGIIIGSTESFGAMSGLIKDFFERIYYPCLESKQGLPVLIYVKAELDGTGTKVGIEKIISGLRWKPIQDTTVLHGPFQEAFVDECEQMGLLMAAGLEAGIY